MNIPHGYVTEDRAEELFIAGLAAMREKIAQEFELNALHETAKNVRSTWLESWGDDPGQPPEIVENCWYA